MISEQGLLTSHGAFLKYIHDMTLQTKHFMLAGGAAMLQLLTPVHITTQETNKVLHI